jgi:hypothetical protein
MNGLNQIIAQGGRQLQLESPLNQLAQVETIRQAQQTNALRQAEMQQLQQEQARTRQTREALARPGVVSPTGQISREKALEGLPGDLSFEVAKQIDEFQASGYKNLSAKAKAIADMTGTYEDQLARAPDLQSFIDISMQMLKDPTYGEFLAKRGSTPDGVMQNIQQVMVQNPQNGLDVLKRRAVSGADTLRQSLVERGTPTALGKLQNELQALLDQGVSPDDPRIRQYNQRIEKEISKPAVAGGTTVNVRTEQAYSGEVAKLAARQDIELADKAAAIPQNIAKIDESLDLLYNSDLSTGLGAEVFNVMDKARAKFLADKDAGKRVENTEYLDALLGSDVFPQISALGIGARGLDTPAEREFLRNVITGTIKLDKGTLIRMTEFRRQGLEDAAKVYNSKVDGGQLDKFFEYTGRPKNKVEVPARPPRGASAAVAAPPAQAQFLRRRRYEPRNYVG